MTLRNGMWGTIGIALILSAFFAWLAFDNGRIPIRFTTQQAQEKLDKGVATFNHKQGEKGGPVTIQSIIVKFVNDRAVIDARVTGAKLGLIVATDIHMDALPGYDHGGIILPTVPGTKPQFSNITVTAVEKKNPLLSAKTKALIKGKVTDFLARHDLTDIAESAKDDAKRWITAAAEEAIVHFLAHHPVYTLEHNTKEIIARAALEDIKVIGNELTFTLSITQLGLSILWAGVLMLASIGFVIFLFTNPEFGIGIMLLGSLGS